MQVRAPVNITQTVLLLQPEATKLNQSGCHPETTTFCAAASPTLVATMVNVMFRPGFTEWRSAVMLTETSAPVCAATGRTSGSERALMPRARTTAAARAVSFTRHPFCQATHHRDYTPAQGGAARPGGPFGTLDGRAKAAGSGRSLAGAAGLEPATLRRALRQSLGQALRFWRLVAVPAMPANPTAQALCAKTAGVQAGIILSFSRIEYPREK